MKAVKITLVFVVLVWVACSKPDPVSDTQSPTAPTNLVVSDITTQGFTLSWTASTDNVGVTGYVVYANGATVATTTGATTALVAELSPATTYVVTVKAKDAAENFSLASGSINVTTLWPAPTAVVNTATSYEASATATDQVLYGNSVAKAFVLNVSTAGTARVEVVGTQTNTQPAVRYYWVNGVDSENFHSSVSTLNSIIPKTEIGIDVNTFMINLNAGVNVICFKTAAYSGLITNGAQVGLKVTLANGVTYTNHYTADSSMNVANVVKMEFRLTNSTSMIANSESPDTTWGNIKVTPYNNETGTVYDGTLYPTITSLKLSTVADWSTGNTTGWSSLNFTNSQGTHGQDFRLYNSDGTILFSNENAYFGSNVLFFQNAVTKIVKSASNYAFLVLDLNVFNTASTQFGPANVTFKYLDVHFVGNPETWVYTPSGVRVQ